MRSSAGSEARADFTGSVASLSIAAGNEAELIGPQLSDGGGLVVVFHCLASR